MLFKANYQENITKVTQAFYKLNRVNDKKRRRMLTFSITYKSQIVFRAVGCFPLPGIILRDAYAHLVRIARFTTLPMSESYLV